ncbi:membrane protein [Streptomyces badius]
MERQGRGEDRTLPEDADQLVFKAIQTYDNKEVVRWIEEPTEGGEEPDSPAPVLKLTAATDDHHGGGAADDAKKADDAKEGDDHKAADTAAPAKETHAAASSSSSDTTARTLGIIGIVIGVAGVAFGVLAGRRRSA